MKNIIKSLIVMLASVSLFGSAYAGSLGVSGTAKATYNITSGNNTSQGKGLGITNELNFTASGELDNGYTWSYSMELDPADGSAGGAATNDDTAIKLTTPYGTVGMFILEGGLDAEDAASQSVYARPTDAGDPSDGTYDNYTIDSYNNLQYHTPADLLPFGITAKIAYAPDLDGTNNSGNATGQAQTLTASVLGRAATEIRVDATPIDGLTVGASYFEFSTGNGVKQDQDPESGAYYAKYATGPFSIGYSQAYKAPLAADNNTAGATTVEFNDQRNYSIAYAASDNLSLSYEVEKDELNYMTAATASLEQTSKAVQIAYTMGGATIALHHGSYDNAGFSDGVNKDQTLVALTLAF
jgi:outer membrane protein OmpU